MLSSSAMPDTEAEVKSLIVEALSLEGITPGEIDSEAPLFGPNGLGLDSIDALELGVAIRKRYGITFTAATEDVKALFASVRSLARYIGSQRNA